MISIIIPVFEEEDSIEQTLNELRDITINIQKYKFQIIVVDDGSQDTSLDKLREWKIKNPGHIEILEHKKNRGYGASLKTGLHKSKGDWILITDMDRTYPIKEILCLIEYIKDFDMVVARRSTEFDPKKRFAKKILKKVGEYVSKRKIPDMNSGMRLFRKDIAMKHWDIFPDGFSFTTTLTMLCLTRDKYLVKWIPIKYQHRTGKSSMKIKHFFTFIHTLFNICVYFSPMRVFVPLSLSILLFSITRLIRDFIVENSFGLFGALLMILAFQVFLLGIIADVISKRRV